MKFVTTLPMRQGAFLGLALLLCAGAANAQMYKWVDANGKTHFTDTPPPAAAKEAPIKSSGASSAAANLPFALANAVKNHPVTLYTTTPCGGCDAARAHLRARGVPFSEKTVMTSADSEKLKEVSGGESLPFVQIGNRKQVGFQPSGWDTMLTAASYPETKMLPPSYQYPAAVSAAPKPAKAEPDREAIRVAAQAEEQRRKAAEPPKAPPGFQF